MTAADLVLACGMCVVTAYGALVVVGGYLKYRNARRRIEAEATQEQDSGSSTPTELPAPSAQPA